MRDPLLSVFTAHSLFTCTFAAVSICRDGTVSIWRQVGFAFECIHVRILCEGRKIFKHNRIGFSKMLTDSPQTFPSYCVCQYHHSSCIAAPSVLVHVVLNVFVSSDFAFHMTVVSISMETCVTCATGSALTLSIQNSRKVCIARHTHSTVNIHYT